MNNQNELNAVSLPEAASIISNALIKEKYNLEQQKKKLLEDKTSYEEAYVKANDGDSSENAPLEAAIQNLKLVTGEIGNNARVLQIMEGLEDVEYLIGTYDFTDITHTCNLLHSDVKSEVLKILSVKDVSDIPNKLVNFEPNDIGYWMGTLSAIMNNREDDVERNNDFLHAVQEYVKVALMPKYNTCGLIVPYTTVRLRLAGNIYTYRIYPEGVSFIDIGVIASDSRVARAMLGRCKGDTFSLQHASNSTLLTYEILDIY